MVRYYICFSPSWFLGYDLFFTFLFTLASLLITSFSYSLYRRSNEKNILLFSISFLFITLSYLFQAITSMFVFLRIKEGVCLNQGLIALTELSRIGLGLHLVFMLAGLSLLLYVTLKKREPKILWIMLIASFVALILSRNYMYTFFILSSVYLAVITWHFLDNYFKNKQKKTFLVALAFLILTLAWIDLLFLHYASIFYVITHIFQLLAFLLIFWNFILVRRP